MLDAILLALPVDDPWLSIQTWYPPPACYFADVICDGAVNVAGIQTVAELWGMQAGWPDYVATYDVVADGVIDIQDIARVSGESGWQP